MAAVSQWLCFEVGVAPDNCLLIGAAASGTHYKNKPTFHYQHQIQLRQRFLLQENKCGCVNMSPLIIHINTD